MPSCFFYINLVFSNIIKILIIQKSHRYSQISMKLTSDFNSTDDEPLNLSKKSVSRESDISSSLSSPLLPSTKSNTSVFSSIWSPASLVSQNEKSSLKEQIQDSIYSNSSHKFRINNSLYDEERHFMRENKEPLEYLKKEKMDFETLKKNCTDIFLLQNNNNNSLTYNLHSSFESSENFSLPEKFHKSRKSLPIIKPDSTAHSDFLIKEYRDEKGKKERSFEVSLLHFQLKIKLFTCQAPCNPYHYRGISICRKMY